MPPAVLWSLQAGSNIEGPQAEAELQQGRSARPSLSDGQSLFPCLILPSLTATAAPKNGPACPALGQAPFPRVVGEGWAYPAWLLPHTSPPAPHPTH